MSKNILVSVWENSTEVIIAKINHKKKCCNSIRLCHTAAILSRETKKALFYHAEPRSQNRGGEAKRGKSKLSWSPGTIWPPCDKGECDYSWTRLIRTQILRIPRYFELKTIPPVPFSHCLSAISYSRYFDHFSNVFCNHNFKTQVHQQRFNLETISKRSVHVTGDVFLTDSTWRKM